MSKKVKQVNKAEVLTALEEYLASREIAEQTSSQAKKRMEELDAAEKSLRQIMVLNRLTRLIYQGCEHFWSEGELICESQEKEGSSVLHLD